VRILSLWLVGRGVKVRIMDDEISIVDLMQTINIHRPRFLLISMVLTEQSARVTEIVQAVQTLTRSVRPDTIVGGCPVKAGLIQSIPAAHLLSDINALQIA
jgi:hypothetical protein